MSSHADYGLIAGEADVDKGPREDDADDDQHDPRPTATERSVSSAQRTEQTNKQKQQVKRGRHASSGALFLS